VSVPLPPELLRPRHIGASEPRIEDEVLLRGAATFVADVRLAGMLELAVLRSPLAHARVHGVDIVAARALPGVRLVATAGDLDGVAPFPDLLPWARPLQHRPLASDRVLHVGQPVALVVADDRYAAEDALDAIGVEYEELPAVVTLQQALAPDAPRLYPDWPDNLVTDLPAADDAEIDELFSTHRVVAGRFVSHRHSGVPIETRGAVARFEAGRLTLWTSQQSPHIERTILRLVLGLPERDIRVIAPAVGGAFGVKCHVYPEDVLVAWAARRLGRPVRFVEDRYEHLVASNHARDQEHELEAAVAEDGTILALRVRVTQDIGSGQIWFPGICPSFVSGAVSTGPYRIDRRRLDVRCAVTNKTPSGAYRGFGVPEMVFALERLVERIADEVGVDSWDLRRRMLLRAEDLPYRTPGGAILDVGSFSEAFERAAALGRAQAERERRSVADRPGVRVGVGLATFWEGTVPSYYGTTGYFYGQDSASVRVEPDGSVVVSVGTTTSGQGVLTYVATVAADLLGVPRDRIRVQSGDTDTCPFGLGGWGSRSAAVAGGALELAGGDVRAKALQIAAHLLEANVADVVVADGDFRVRGSDVAVSWERVAEVATIRTVDLPPGLSPGLEAQAVYDPPTLQHGPDEAGGWNAAIGIVNATHVAVVAVDLETGVPEVRYYGVVHDCGPLVNPPIVEGQVHGGVVQELGGTLLEQFAYDDHGQPLAVNLVDYLVPTASAFPRIHVEHFETPSPATPFGVKGAGEGGTCGVPAAVSIAVDDALREFGVRFDELPITPTRMRAALRDRVPVRRAGIDPEPQEPA
jgi:carbon-monoxide dehydrogenase large subunit